MNTQSVEVRKNITMLFNVNLNGKFTYNINTVDFIPDEVNIKLVILTSPLRCSK